MMSLWMGMGLAAIWLSLTVTLLGGMWVLPVRTIVLPRVKRPWLWRYLRGDMGIWGPLRAGVFVAAAGWWYQAAGFSLPQDVRDIAVLLLGASLLVAEFNAGRVMSLASITEVAFCSVLAIGWLGWLAVLVDVLHRG
ncbi:hypothetical protein RGI97_001093 [Serratia marcescens]